MLAVQQSPAVRFPVATAAHLRAAAGEGEKPPATEPDWRVDAAGAFLGGAALGTAGMYGGMEAGMALAASRLAGSPPLIQVLGILSMGVQYMYLGAIAGAVVGTAAGAALGVWAARALAK